MEQAHRRHDISDHLWGLLAPYLPGQSGQWGGIAKDNRQFINAVFWILRTGAPWRDLPPDYGYWKNWLMISTLAYLIAWIIGFSAEKTGLHYDFQANTYRYRRVLSFFYLGCQIVRKKIKIPIRLENVQKVAWDGLAWDILC